MVKRFLIMGMVILLVLSSQAYGFAAGSRPSIELDGIEMQAAAHVEEGNLYLPLRAVAEALGYDVEWSAKDQTITVSGPGKDILIDPANFKITANGHACYISGDYPGTATSEARIVDSRAYMGAGFYSDNLGLKASWDRQTGKVTLESVKENAVTIKTVREASEDKNIKITLQYPQIDGLENRAVQEGINSAFKESAEAAKAEGLENAEELAEEAQGYTGSPNRCETYFDYRVKYNQNGLLSLVFMDYQYSGGAHGLTVQSSRTFDLKTGGEYGLKDLFKTGSDFVPFINSSVSRQINDRIKEGMLPEHPLEAFQSIGGVQAFYLTNDAAVVYFQQYEYFPYAAGIQAFPTEYAALKDMLKPEFGFLIAGARALEASPTVNSLKTGDTGRIVLKGNPTTGYTWHYSIDNKDIIDLYSESSAPASGMIGAVSTFSWSFRALKAGQAKITFKYYRDWEGEASATEENTAEYLVDVSLPGPAD